jgi:hypothetical protein
MSLNTAKSAHIAIHACEIARLMQQPPLLNWQFLLSNSWQKYSVNMRIR